MTAYQEKKAAPRNQGKTERIQKHGAMQFREYTVEWKAGRRDLAQSSLRTLKSLLEHCIRPTLGSRRMSTFDHKVVDGFIHTLERNGAGLATQSNGFDKVKSVLLDAYRLGIHTENPVLGAKPPQYDAERAIIPSPAQLRDIRTADDDRFLLIAGGSHGRGLPSLASSVCVAGTGWVCSAGSRSLCRRPHGGRIRPMPSEGRRVRGIDPLLFRPDEWGVRQQGRPKVADLVTTRKRLIVFSDRSDREHLGVMYDRSWTVSNYWSLGDLGDDLAWSPAGPTCP
ncbi:hypothetical protein ABT246_07745 [Streptomyces sp. NPDC001553]|uniref:hypothetical protein n=1 Tax=Streptomyces sp. NPDC001553 TaxID=3154385 RepID=UPI0033191B27